MWLQSFLVGAALITVLYFRLARAIAYDGGVPRFGKLGVLGYIQAALRWTRDAEALITEGRKQFNNGPFVIPMFNGNLFLLPPKYLERLRAATDSVFDQRAAIDETFQVKYTMDKFQLDLPYHAKVIRTDATRAIPAFIPEIREESTLAISKVLKPVSGKDSVSLPVFGTVTHLIARISNRVILGKELTRNEGFIHALVTFARTVLVMAPFIQWSPLFLRPLVYFTLSSIFGGKKSALKYLVPHLKKYKERSDIDEEPALIMEYLLRAAPANEPIEVTAVRLLNINFAGIHTSSVFITQTLFEIALLSQEDVGSIRTEVEEALQAEGGWTKGALDKFYKLDSALRETGRFYGLMQVAIPRVAVVGCELGNGEYIPAGYRVAVDKKAIHFDPDIYPDPYRCDPFRFAKLRGSDPSDLKHSFSTIDATYLAFGAGRHACAGRWFASTVLKLILAHVILEYDVSYPLGITTRPKNIVFNGTIVPDPKAHLVFKCRSTKKAV